MPRPKPSLRLLRTLAGEGDFHLYRLLGEGKGVFVFFKCLRTVLYHALNGGSRSNATTVIFVTGKNQLRLSRRQLPELKREFGDFRLGALSLLKGSPEILRLPRFRIGHALRQILLLFLMLITSRRRYLNLFLLEFFNAIRESSYEGLPRIATLICYNDQPFQTAAVIAAVHERGSVRTIVIQHGLILSETFYFPTNAQEFRAWGELSREHYRSRCDASRFVVSGRYVNDQAQKSNSFVLPTNVTEEIKILAATSHATKDLRELVSAISRIMHTNSGNARFAIKLHPATKFAWLTRLWLRRALPGVRIETGEMEDLAPRYDILVTKNSTSALDFLLLGKPVFVTEVKFGKSFPSSNYAFDIVDFADLPLLTDISLTRQNNNRLEFLKDSLNV